MSINRPASLIIAGAAILCASALAVPAWRHWHETAPPLPDALRLTLPPFDDLTLGTGSDHPFGLALAPDGRRLAFPASRAGTSQIWVRQVTTGEAAALPGTEGGILPFWSPDGQQLGFFADARLKTLTLSSGQIRELADAPAPRGGVWHPSGAIVFAPKNDSGLVEWRPDTADLRVLTQVDAARGESSHRFPTLARRPGEPSRWEVVFFVQASEAARGGLWTASGVRLTASDTSALAADDWLLYARGNALLAQRIEWSDENEPRPALAGQAQLIGMPVGRSALGQLFATTAADAIVYGSAQTQLRDLRWVDRRDATQGTLAAQVDAWDLRIAPHGGRVAVTQLDTQLGTLDVWVYDGGRLLPRRVSQAIDVDELAVWSPDASRLAWVQARRAIMTRGAQAQLPEQPLRQFDTPIRLWDWSPDGKHLVVGRNRPGTRDDLIIISAGSGASGESPYAQSAFNEVHADISPDGHWMAYASDESGQPEVYVDSFPTPGRRARVTTGGGSEPRWGTNATEMFFRRGSEMHVASVSFPGDTPEATGTARLFDAGGDIRAYDVTPDGQRFLLNVPAPTAKPQPIVVIVNWRSLLQ
jgi:Tol biopolymer transport system component